MQEPQTPPPDTEASASREEGGLGVAEFLRQHREAILEDWQRSTHALHTSREVAGIRLLDHIPELLDRMADALESGAEGPAALPSYLSDVHAFERLQQGFDLHELALEYGHLRRCILHRLEALPTRLRRGELARLDEALDGAVARAITTYASARERTLRALERMSQAGLDSPDPDTLLTRLLALLMESTVLVDSVSVLLLEGDVLRAHAALGLGAEAARGHTWRLGEGFAGHVATERKPLAVHSASHGPALRDELLRSLRLRALYGVPLLDGERLVGVAYMGSRTAHAFSDADSLLFHTMCSRATQLLVQAQLRAAERTARDETQRSLALVETLLLAAPVGIAVLDTQLRYVRINEVLALINGKPVEAHLGRTVREMVEPAVANFVDAPLRRVLETGEPEVGLEFSAEVRPGVQHQWVANYFPVRSASGELLGIGATVVDISAHKEAEATLEQAVAFREQLIAVLGHDLRNPLNAIGASAFQLTRAEGLEESERKAVERIRRTTGRMARMIADILDFARSRLGGGIPVASQRVDLAELCRAALEELQVTQPERRILFEAQGDTVGTWDPDRVTQVLGNLVSNSLQHGRLDTPVRVRVRGEPEDVVMEVHNEGEPIPADRLPRLFDPFKGGTRPNNTTGLGLGLYIVQQIARAHGGDVSVTSTAEAGTTFTVRWPREPPAQGTPAPFAPPAVPVV